MRKGGACLLGISAVKNDSEGSTEVSVRRLTSVVWLEGVVVLVTLSLTMSVALRGHLVRVAGSRFMFIPG